MTTNQPARREDQSATHYLRKDPRVTLDANYLAGHAYDPAGTRAMIDHVTRTGSYVPFCDDLKGNDADMTLSERDPEPSEEADGSALVGAATAFCATVGTLATLAAIGIATLGGPYDDLYAAIGVMLACIVVLWGCGNWGAE